MQLRSMHASSANSSFSTWLAQKEEQQVPKATQEPSTWGTLGQLSAIRDSFASQFEGLAGSLPDAGAVNAFRERLTNAIYMLLAAIGFALLAVFVGLPTLMVRPSKFVLCLSLSTLLAAGSVIVMQRPQSFVQGVLGGGLAQSGPIAALVASQFVTIYITVFVHKYVYVLAAAGFQVLCLLFYLASFIPGGTKGVQLLLKMMYMIVSTTLRPLLYLVRTLGMQCLRTVWS